MNLIQDVLAGFVTPKKSTVTKTAITITPKLSPVQQQAIDVSRNVRMTAWVNKSVPMQNLLTNIRTAVTVKKIKDQGVSLIPTSELTEKQATIVNQETSIKALNKALGDQTKAQAEYYTKISESMQTLQEGTQKSAVLEGQLGYTTAKYTELVDNPKTVSEGTDWKGLIILGAIAIGGVFVLKSLLEKK